MKIEPHHKNTCLTPYANDKDADQPAHLCSLISVFVFDAQNSISLVSIFAISLYSLASVAEQAGLILTWSETPEDRFSCDVAQLSLLPTKEQNGKTILFSQSPSRKG